VWFVRFEWPLFFFVPHCVLFVYSVYFAVYSVYSVYLSVYLACGLLYIDSLCIESVHRLFEHCVCGLILCTLLGSGLALHLLSFLHKSSCTN